MSYKLAIGIILSISVLAFVLYNYRKTNSNRSATVHTNADDGMSSSYGPNCSGSNSSCDSGGDGGGDGGGGD